MLHKKLNVRIMLPQGGKNEKRRILAGYSRCIAVVNGLGGRT